MHFPFDIITPSPVMQTRHVSALLQLSQSASHDISRTQRSPAELSRVPLLQPQETRSPEEDKAMTWARLAQDETQEEAEAGTVHVLLQNG